MIDWLSSVWPLISHAGIGFTAVAGLAAAAWFSPVFKKELAYGAVVVAVALFVYGVGVHDEKVKRDGQEQAMSKKVHDAVEKATQDNTVDPYDNPRN